MRVTLVTLSIVACTLAPANATGHGWAWVNGSGAGMAGDYDWDQAYPQDDAGVRLYPTLRACERDKAMYLKETEHATPLIDNDQPSGYSASAHKDLADAREASCQPYLKGRFDPLKAEERSDDGK